MRRFGIMLCGTMLLLGSMARQSDAVTVFTSRAAWELAVGSFSTEDFNGLAVQDFGDGTHDVGLLDIDVVGTGSLSFPVSIADSSNGLNIDGTNFIRGASLPAAGPTLVFDSPVIGFGADWTSTHTAGGLTLSVPGMTIEFDVELPSGNGDGFLGIVSATPFSSAVLRTELNGTEGYGIDNLSFAVAGAVPEPITATLGLMGLGVLGMATRRRVA